MYRGKNVMKWEMKKPCKGDAIRTKVSFYHHYGIYIDDDTVVQFGLPDNTGRKIEDIDVCITNIVSFAEGRCVEKAKFSFSEKTQLKNPEEIVKAALSEVGNKGYDFFMNNCADFVNRCIFKEGSKLDVLEIRNQGNK